MRTLNSRILAAIAALSLVASVLSPELVSAAPGNSPVTGSFFLDFDRDGSIDAGEAVDSSHPLFFV